MLTELLKIHVCFIMENIKQECKINRINWSSFKKGRYCKLISIRYYVIFVVISDDNCVWMALSVVNFNFNSCIIVPFNEHAVFNEHPRREYLENHY